MKTNTFTILKYSFSLSLLIVITGALFKINHMPAANALLTIGLIFTFIYTVAAILEIFNSRRINSTEKLMWLIGFLFFNFITGILYILSARKRIVAAY
ncbi:GldL-related protein [Flavobacterium sp. 3HN19-14]|uniref:GldL-related protein n=1 Tax=Flavobacterium sp. 3HN19-14 TaxID=3448133 RepID=UPI003EE0FB6B